MSDNVWLSTKALSVHNVLVKAGRPLSADELLDALRSWRADISPEYVDLGLSYLAAGGFAVAADDKFTNAQPGRRLKRVRNDIDLDWA